MGVKKLFFDFRSGCRTFPSIFFLMKGLDKNAFNNGNFLLILQTYQSDTGKGLRRWTPKNSLDFYSVETHIFR
jgi:hypothetical protein